MKTILISVFAVALILLIISLVIRKRQPLKHSAEQKNFGKFGESVVATALAETQMIYGGYLFNNFTFLDAQGFSSEIDHIYICGGGIFVVETKSNKGTVYGKKSDEYWLAKKQDWQEDKTFINPIKQNEGHINHLKKLLGNTGLEIYSLIIFPFADIYHVLSKNVCNIYDGQKFISKKISEKTYPEQTVIKTYFKLLKIQQTYGINSATHLKNINRKK